MATWLLATWHATQVRLRHTPEPGFTWRPTTIPSCRTGLLHDLHSRRRTLPQHRAPGCEGIVIFTRLLRGFCTATTNLPHWASRTATRVTVNASLEATAPSAARCSSWAGDYYLPPDPPRRHWRFTATSPTTAPPSRCRTGTETTNPKPLVHLRPVS